jgi:predicted trehalose synthase
MSEAWQADVEAASAVSRTLGLANVAPVVLHVGGRTTVRLAPWPIVARVLSTFSLERMMPGVRRELRVARHLAAKRAPTVAPTIDPPPGPYVVGEATVTLWKLVEHRKAKGRADALDAGRALAALHASLSDFPGRLPLFTQDFDHCAAFLADANALGALAASDRAFLAGRLDDLRAALAFDRSQFIPLHGDAHLGNVLMAEGGAVWADLESVCLGPVEWDLTSLPHAARAAFPGLDRPLFRQLSLLRSVIVCVWCAYHAERSPEMRAVGAHHLLRLRRLS